MTTTQNPSPKHFVDFFAPYGTEFAYDPTRRIMDEFERLCAVKGWSANNKARKAALGKLRIALVKQFNLSFGTDLNKLDSWHALCCTLAIEPLPTCITACRNAVKSVHVNLVDLVDARVRGGHVQKFPSQRALSSYTKKTKKFFPKEVAKSEEYGLLRYLLREIMRPSGRKH